MNRLAKGLLIFLATLALLAVALFVGLNLYLRSAGTQARIQQQLSEALGIPVQITRCTVTLSGVHMSGIRVPDGTRTLLEAPNFRADYALWPLLRRRLEVKRMVLESPRVLWAQNAEGKWVLPLLPAKTERAEKNEKIALPNETVAGTPKPKPIAAATPAAPRKRSLEVVLDTLEVQDAMIELLDAQEQRVAVAQGVNMRYLLSSPSEVQGSFTADRLVWEDNLTFTAAKAKLRLEDDELRLQDFEADLASGKVTGQLYVHTGKRNSPFKANLTLANVDLAQISSDHDWAANKASGMVGGEVKLEGHLRKMHKVTGEGYLAVTEGRFAQLNLLQTVGTILQIPELADLRVKNGRADFKLGGEKVELKPLVLESGEIQFATKGTIKFDKRLDLEARLAASPAVLNQLPGVISERFDAPDPQGRRGIAFTVKGTTDRPRPDLVEKVIGQRLSGQLEGLVGALFGGGGEKKQEDEEAKKKRKEQEKEEKRLRKEAEKKAREEAEAAARSLPPVPATTPAPAQVPTTAPQPPAGAPQ